MTEPGQLKVVLKTDAAGFSASMRLDERKALLEILADMKVLNEAITDSGGQILKTEGDGMLCIFTSAVEAVSAALKIQSSSTHFQFRTGVHLGEVTLTKGDAYGDAVNICARLEAHCLPGSILLSTSVAEAIYQSTIAQPDYVGKLALKGLDEPIGVCSFGQAPRIPPAPKRFSKFSTWIKIWVFGLIIAALIFVIYNRTDRTKKAVAPPPRVGRPLKATTGESSGSETGQTAAPDVDALMDEAYATVLDELDAFSKICSTARAKENPQIVLDWLKNSDFGTRDRGSREVEHWELVAAAFNEAKKMLGKEPNATEVHAALRNQKDGTTPLLYRVFCEEFPSR